MVYWVLVQIAIAVAISVIAHALAPKPKSAKPSAAQDLDNPTAEAGRPVPVVFGTVTVKGSNILWFGEKDVDNYKIKA